MGVTLDDKVMKGFLISLGFNAPHSSVDENIPETFATASGDPIIIARLITDAYGPNKKKISMKRTRIYEGSNVLEETISFAKKNVEAGLTYHPFKNFERQETQIHCNTPELEAQIERGLKNLPANVKVQEQLQIIYDKLLGYVPKLITSQPQITSPTK